VESFLVVLTPPSGGRVSLLVIASLVMSGCHAGSLHHHLCDVDEFYDAVVDDCARCSDVCDLCLAPESQSFCVRNCPGSFQLSMIMIWLLWWCVVLKWRWIRLTGYI